MEIREVRDACNDSIIDSDDDNDEVLIQGLHDSLSRPYNDQIVATNARLEKTGMPARTRMVKLAKLQKVVDARKTKEDKGK